MLNDYCMPIKNEVVHLVANAHTQNGLVESVIKCLQLIVRPLLMRSELLIFC